MTKFAHLFLLATSFHLGYIEITQGPSNVTAYVGDSITLPCRYTGTDNQPKWRIGGVTHTSADLPAGYQYINEGLQIPSIWAQLNKTDFICFFTIYVEGEGFREIESDVAFITVKIRETVSTTSAANIWTTIFEQLTVTPSFPTAASTQRRTNLDRELQSKVPIILCGVLLCAVVVSMRLFRKLAWLCLRDLLLAVVVCTRLFRKLAWLCLGVPLLPVVVSMCLVRELAKLCLDPRKVRKTESEATEVEATEKE